MSTETSGRRLGLHPILDKRLLTKEKKENCSPIDYRGCSTISIEREVRAMPDERRFELHPNRCTEENSWSGVIPSTRTPPLDPRELPDCDQFVKMSFDGTRVSNVAAIDQGGSFSRHPHTNDPQWLWMGLSSPPMSLYPSTPGQSYKHKVMTCSKRLLRLFLFCTLTLSDHSESSLLQRVAMSTRWFPLISDPSMDILHYPRLFWCALYKDPIPQ